MNTELRSSEWAIFRRKRHLKSKQNHQHYSLQESQAPNSNNHASHLLCHTVNINWNSFDETNRSTIVNRINKVLIHHCLNRNRRFFISNDINTI